MISKQGEDVVGREFGAVRIVHQDDSRYAICGFRGVGLVRKGGLGDSSSVKS